VTILESNSKEKYLTFFELFLIKKTHKEVVKMYNNYSMIKKIA
jgi:hypothetical protein